MWSYAANYSVGGGAPPPSAAGMFWASQVIGALIAISLAMLVLSTA